MENAEQLLECPWCGENQPAESARWDQDGTAYETICQTCCKKFMGFVYLASLAATDSAVTSPP